MAWHVGGETSVFANGVAGLHAIDMLLIEAGGIIDKADGGSAGMASQLLQTAPTLVVPTTSAQGWHVQQPNRFPSPNCPEHHSAVNPGILCQAPVLSNWVCGPAALWLILAKQPQAVAGMLC